MVVDFDISLRAITVVISVIALAISIIGARRQEVTTKIDGVNARIDAVAKRAEAAERDLERVTAQVSALPSNRQVRDLEIGITRIGGTLEAMTAKLEGQMEIMKRIEGNVNLHQEYLTGTKK